MKRLFRIDESEKNRILGMYKSATSRQYLKEQDETDNQTDAGDETSQETTTNQTSSQETYSCDKVNEYLNDEGVKKWIKAIKDNKSEIMKGSEKNEENPAYKGIKKVIAIIQCKLKELQLNPGTIDGIFGNNTKNAVVDFQRKNELKDDGIVGDNTWAKMFPESAEPEETPAANECHMNFGEGEGQIPDSLKSNFENETSKVVRKRNNKIFVFIGNSSDPEKRVSVIENGAYINGNYVNSTYLWRCVDNNVQFFKIFNF